MKKRIIGISSIIIFVLLLLIIIANKNEKVYTEIDGIKYAILINGEPSTTFPSGNYKANIKCTNADAYWNSIESKVIIKNIRGSVTCDVAFNSINSADYLDSYILSNVGEQVGNGYIINENGLRYEGENPNNYILYNNELWRIIGLFETEYDTDNNNTIDSTDNLIKIIRYEPIGSYAWNKNSSNNWPNSTLFHLLNDLYYNWSANSNNASSYCYLNSALHTNCDFSIIGIKDGYRNMIAKVKWYLGGGGKSGYTTYKADNIYSYERNTSAIYSGNPTTTIANIGLVYPSDYMYAVLKNDCEPGNTGARQTLSSNYGNYNCGGKDWILSVSREWALSPYSNLSFYAFYLSADAHLGANPIYNSYSIRPVLYLLNSTYIISGSGTLTDPYIIGMATNN